MIDWIVHPADQGAVALLSSSLLIDPVQARLLVARGLSTREEAERFLEPSCEQLHDPFLFGEMESPFQGIALPGDVLEKIYRGNFERLVGHKPATLNPGAIVAECERVAAVAGMIGAAVPDTTPDTSVAEMVKAFFEARI